MQLQHLGVWAGEGWAPGQKIYQSQLVTPVERILLSRKYCHSFENFMVARTFETPADKRIRHRSMCPFTTAPLCRRSVSGRHPAGRVLERTPCHGKVQALPTGTATTTATATDDDVLYAGGHPVLIGLPKLITAPCGRASQVLLESSFSSRSSR